MFWLILVSCTASDTPSPEALQETLQKAELRIEELEAEVEDYRRRMSSIERLDAAMETAHTLVAARCEPSTAENQGDHQLDSTGWEELAGDPSGVLAQGRWLPHGGAEKPLGWRLVRIARGGLLDSCGLKSADVLQRVNGVSMVEPGGPMEAASKASAEGAVRLEILRNRKPLTLTIHRVSD